MGLNSIELGIRAPRENTQKDGQTERERSGLSCFHSSKELWFMLGVVVNLNIMTQSSGEIERGVKMRWGGEEQKATVAPSWQHGA